MAVKTLLDSGRFDPFALDGNTTLHHVADWAEVELNPHNTFFGGNVGKNADFMKSGTSDRE